MLTRILVAIVILSALCAPALAGPKPQRLTDDQKKKLLPIINTIEESLRKGGNLDDTVAQVFGTGANEPATYLNPQMKMKDVVKLMRQLIEKRLASTACLPSDKNIAQVRFGKDPDGNGPRPAPRGLLLNKTWLDRLCLQGNQNAGKRLQAKMMLTLALTNEMVHLVQRQPPANLTAAQKRAYRCDMERDSDRGTRLFLCAFVDQLTDGQGNPNQSISPTQCPWLTRCLISIGVLGNQQTVRVLANFAKTSKQGITKRIDDLFTPGVTTAPFNWTSYYKGARQNSRKGETRNGGTTKRFIDPSGENFIDINSVAGYFWVASESNILDDGREVFQLLMQDKDGLFSMLTTYIDADGDGLPDPVPVGQVLGPIKTGPRADGELHLYQWYPDTGESGGGVMFVDSVSGAIWAAPANADGVPTGAFVPKHSDARLTDAGGGYNIPAVVIADDVSSRIIFTADGEFIDVNPDSVGAAIDFVGGPLGTITSGPTGTVGELGAGAAFELVDFVDGEFVVPLVTDPGEFVWLRAIGRGDNDLLASLNITDPTGAQVVGVPGPLEREQLYFYESTNGQEIIQFIPRLGIIQGSVLAEESGDSNDELVAVSVEPGRLHVLSGFSPVGGVPIKDMRYEQALEEPDAIVGLGPWDNIEGRELHHRELGPRPLAASVIDPAMGERVYFQSLHDFDDDAADDDGVLVLRPFNFDPDSQFEVRLFTDVPGAIQCEFIEFLPVGFEPYGIEYGAVARGSGTGVRIDDFNGQSPICYANVGGTLVPGDCVGDCPADLAEPFGVLNFDDVLVFLTAFNAGTPEADLAEPFGVFDFSDVLAFLTSFQQGCP